MIKICLVKINKLVCKRIYSQQQQQQKQQQQRNLFHLIFDILQ